MNSDTQHFKTRAQILHPIAGTIALLTIMTFWLSTFIVEIFAHDNVIIAVKRAIPWGFILFIPAIISTGMSGVILSHGNRKGLIGKKIKRMPFIALNGLVILMPIAFYLSYKAGLRELDTTFYTFQIIELIAGALNISLLSRNFIDGIRLHRSNI